MKTIQLFSTFLIMGIGLSAVNAEKCPSYMVVDSALKEKAHLDADGAFKLGEHIAPEGMSVGMTSFSANLNSHVEERDSGDSVDCTYKIGDQAFYSVSFNKKH